MENNSLKNFLKKVKLNESTISMVLGVLVIVVIGALIFNYFRNIERPGEEMAIEGGEIRLVEENGQMVPEGLPVTHKVAQGEDLWTIAEKYYGSGYNWVSIVSENNLTNPDRLLVGQKLIIPKTTVINVETTQSVGEKHTVLPGESLWDIAVKAYGDGYQWVKIAQANNLTNPDVIHAGNVLNLP